MKSPCIAATISVELLSTSRINELLTRPQSYGTINLLTVKQARVTQWLMNLVLVMLAIPCVMTREPGRLETGFDQAAVSQRHGTGLDFHLPADRRSSAWHRPYRDYLAGTVRLGAGIPYSRRQLCFYWTDCTPRAAK